MSSLILLSTPHHDLAVFFNKLLLNQGFFAAPNTI